jgi:hypothetical protein
MRDFFLVLVGGLCSALAGCAASCIAIWYQARKARQTRMEERAGERQFEVSTEALKLIRELRTLLTKREPAGAQQFFKDNVGWFSTNWMFLPNGFIEAWKSIDLGLAELSREDLGAKTTPDEQKKHEYIEKAVDLGARLPEQALKAENTLRKEMGLKNAE